MEIGRSVSFSTGVGNVNQLGSCTEQSDFYREMAQTQRRVQWLEATLALVKPELLATYQMEYPASASPVSPLRETSISAHGSNQSLLLPRQHDTTALTSQSLVYNLISNIFAIRSPGQDTTLNIPILTSQRSTTTALAQDAVQCAAALLDNDERPHLDRHLMTVDPSNELPSKEETYRVVRMFAEDLKLTHQVTSLRQLHADIRNIYSPTGLLDTGYAASRFRVFSILFLAGGDILAYTSTDQDTLHSYRDRATAELPALIVKADVVSLILLDIQSLMNLSDLRTDTGPPGFDRALY